MLLVLFRGGLLTSQDYFRTWSRYLLLSFFQICFETWACFRPHRSRTICRCKSLRWWQGPKGSDCLDVSCNISAFSRVTPETRACSKMFLYIRFCSSIIYTSPLHLEGIHLLLQRKTTWTCHKSFHTLEFRKSRVCLQFVPSFFSKSVLKYHRLITVSLSTLMCTWAQ